MKIKKEVEDDEEDRRPEYVLLEFKDDQILDIRQTTIKFSVGDVSQFLWVDKKKYAAVVIATGTRAACKKAKLALLECRKQQKQKLGSITQRGIRSSKRDTPGAYALVKCDSNGALVVEKTDNLDGGSKDSVITKGSPVKFQKRDERGTVREVKGSVVETGGKKRMAKAKRGARDEHAAVDVAAPAHSEYAPDVEKTDSAAEKKSPQSADQVRKLEIKTKDEGEQIDGKNEKFVEAIPAPCAENKCNELKDSQDDTAEQVSNANLETMIEVELAPALSPKAVDSILEELDFQHKSVIVEQENTDPFKQVRTAAVEESQLVSRFVLLKLGEGQFEIIETNANPVAGDDFNFPFSNGMTVPTKVVESSENSSDLNYLRQQLLQTYFCSSSYVNQVPLASSSFQNKHTVSLSSLEPGCSHTVKESNEPSCSYSIQTPGCSSYSEKNFDYASESEDDQIGDNYEPGDYDDEKSNDSSSVSENEAARKASGMVEPEEKQQCSEGQDSESSCDDDQDGTDVVSKGKLRDQRKAAKKKLLSYQGPIRVLTQDDVDICGRFHYCLYCKVAVNDVRIHLLNLHAHEEEVARSKSLATRLERSQAFCRLRRMGNNAHNKDVVASGIGLIIPERVSAESEFKKFVCCHHCEGWLARRSWSTHSKECFGDRLPITNNDTLVAFRNNDEMEQSNKNESLAEEVLFELWKMQDKEFVKEAIKRPPLLDMLTQVYQIKRIKKPYAAGEELRKAALLIRAFFMAFKSSSDGQNFFEVVPSIRHIKQILEAIRVAADFDHTSGAYKKIGVLKPLVPKLKLYLQCLSINLAVKGNASASESVENLLQSMNTKNSWFMQRTTTVTSASIKSNRTTQKNPIKADLEKLKLYNKMMIETSRKTLESKAASPKEKKKAFRMFIGALQNRITSYNGRRKTEVSSLLMSEISNEHCVDSDKDLKKFFTPEERKFCKFYKVMDNNGKCDEKAVTMVPLDCHPHLDYLVNIRCQFGVHKDNPYLFGLPGPDKNKFERGYSFQNKAAHSCDAKYPDTLTSRGFRRGLITGLRPLKLSRDNVDVSAKFFSHSEQVHQSVYKQFPGMVAIQTIGKYLYAADRNKVHENRGKDFDEMEIGLSDKNITDESSDDDYDEKMPSGKRKKKQPLENDAPPTKKKRVRRFKKKPLKKD